MPRSFTPDIVAAIGEKTVYPALLFQGEFATGSIYLWSGRGPLEWNGQTWLGTYGLTSLSPVAETTDVSAQGVTATLCSIPSDLLAAVENEVRLGKKAAIYLALFDAAGNLIADPYPVFLGRIDVPTLSEDTANCSVDLSIETILIDLNRAHERRYTDADQQIDHPGDHCFKFMDALQNQSLIWGNANISPSQIYSTPVPRPDPVR